MANILIAHNFSPNSISGMSYFLAHQLASEGNNVLFISYRPYFESPVNFYNGRLKVHSWNSRQRPTGILDFIHFVKIFLRFRPQIVIGHFVGANISIMVSKILSLGRCRTFEYYHTLSTQIKLDIGKGFVSRFIQQLKFLRKRIYYKLFTDKVLATSDMASVDYANTYKLHNVIDHITPLLDRFIEEPLNIGNKLTVAFLGRMEPSKGILPMIDAITVLRTQFKFKLAGYGSMESQVSSICDGSQVSYLGNLPYEDIDPLIQSCDIILVPSLKDNLVTVGIETLMNKRCLVVSKHTALSEYLVDGIDCVKIAPDASEIICALRDLDVNREKLLRIAGSGRAKYQSLFSMEGYFGTMKNILSLK
jgi:glycosyltransferase involved in cell wall biosynthesis